MIFFLVFEKNMKILTDRVGCTAVTVKNRSDLDVFARFIEI